MKLENKFGKVLLIGITAVLIMSSLVGCTQKQDILEKIIYRDKECPTPKIKPIFKEYEMVILEINGEEYYALPKSEALKMSTNWISYKSWAEANYLLIKKSKESKKSKVTKDKK